MSTNIEKYQAAKQRVQDAREEMKTVAKQAFSEGTDALFAEHQSLVSFSWTQYAPYFNDGDPCVFSAHTEYLLFRFTDSEPIEDEDNYDEGDDELDKPSLVGYGENKKSIDELDANGKAAYAALDFMEGFGEDDLKEMFGESNRVIVRRGAVEVQEYDHD